jgi:diacylglycerol kinase (ATP)
VRVLVLANPGAGAQVNAEALAPAVQALEAEGHRVQLVETAAPGHALELARELSARFDRVVACGGDGTVSEVARGMLAAGSTAALALVPAGTGNDLATALGIEADGALQLAVGGDVVRVDVGLAGERPFVNASSVGPWAELSQSVGAGLKSALGPLSYLAAGLTRSGWRTPFRARLTAGDAVIEGEMQYLAVANGPTVGGGSRVAPDASLDDGLLDAVVLPALPLPELLAAAAALRSGTPHEALVRVRASELHLVAEEELTLTCDGEAQRKREVTFRVLPGALALVVPRKELTPLGAVP